MPDTGWLDHGTFYNDDFFGGPEWTSLTDAVSENGVYAFVEIPADSEDNTDLLRGQNISASIPVGAAIDGVEVRIKWYKENSNLSTALHSLRLHKDGGAISESKGVFTQPTLTNNWTITFGGPTDRWAVQGGLDRDDVNDVTFGVHFNCSTEAVGGPWDLYVDCVQIKIYYSFNNTGWLDCNTVINSQSGGEDWGSPQYAQKEDGLTASCAIPYTNGSPPFSDDLRGYNIAESIPGGMDIDGIEVQYRWYGDGTDIQETYIKLHKGGTAQGDDKSVSAVLPSGPPDSWSAIYGGPADLWNTGFGYADVTDPAFGVDLTLFNDSSTVVRTAYVDVIQIKVYYSLHQINPLPSFHRQG